MRLLANCQMPAAPKSRMISSDCVASRSTTTMPWVVNVCSCAHVASSLVRPHARAPEVDHEILPGAGVEVADGDADGDVSVCSWVQAPVSR